MIPIAARNTNESSTHTAKGVQNSRIKTIQNNKTETARKTEQKMSQQTVKKTFNNTTKICDINFAPILDPNPTTFTYARPYSHKKNETGQTNDT